MKSFNVPVRRMPKEPGEARRISLMIGPSLRTVTIFSILGPAPILNSLPAEAKDNPTMTSEKAESNRRSVDQPNPRVDWKAFIMSWLRLTPLKEIAVQLTRSAPQVKGKTRKTFNPRNWDTDAENQITE